MHEEQDELGDDFVDEDEDDYFDCHMDPDTGQCGKAGSEECDFECPFRSELR
jgi:hypothetical protein